MLEADQGHASARFHPLALRRYQIFEADLTGCADPLTAAEAALPNHTAMDVCRLLLTGEFSMEPHILSRLEQALAPRFHALELRDRTRAPRDLWARAGEDTLTGLFLRTMAPQCEACPNDDVLQMAVRFGLAALENGEDIAP